MVLYKKIIVVYSSQEIISGPGNYRLHFQIKAVLV